MKVRIKDGNTRIWHFFLGLMPWFVCRYDMTTCLSVHCSSLLCWEISHYFQCVSNICTSKKWPLDSVISGIDLTCSYSADFGANARVEWKFKNILGSQVYVVFDGKPTGEQAPLFLPDLKMTCNLGAFHNSFLFCVTEPYSSRLTMYDSNLRFSKVTRKDIGVYDCEVSGNSQFGEVRVTLTVLGRNPPLTFWQIYLSRLHSWHRRFSPLSQSADIWTFCHAVPPSPPMCTIPTSVTTGKTAILGCHDADGSPPPTYRWFKNGVPLPAEPSKISGYQNATYNLDTNLGSLVRQRVHACLSVPAGVLLRCSVLKVSFLSDVPQNINVGLGRVLLRGCE